MPTTTREAFARDTDEAPTATPDDIVLAMRVLEACRVIDSRGTHELTIVWRGTFADALIRFADRHTPLVPHEPPTAREEVPPTETS